MKLWIDFDVFNSARYCRFVITENK